MSDIGDRLRSVRRDAGLSQSDLERLSGVPKTRLSRYENGHFYPSVRTLKKLAGALGVSETSLVSGTSPEELLLQELRAHGIRIESVDRAREIAAHVAQTFSPEGETQEGTA